MQIKGPCQSKCFIRKTKQIRITYTDVSLIDWWYFRSTVCCLCAAFIWFWWWPRGRFPWFPSDSYSLFFNFFFFFCHNCVCVCESAAAFMCCFIVKSNPEEKLELEFCCVLILFPLLANMLLSGSNGKMKLNEKKDMGSIEDFHNLEQFLHSNQRASKSPSHRIRIYCHVLAAERNIYNQYLNISAFPEQTSGNMLVCK